MDESLPQASTSFTREDMDQWLSHLFRQDAHPAEYVFVSEERYLEIKRIWRRAQRRHWQISQKDRAEWKRRHREAKRARAILAMQWRRR